MIEYCISMSSSFIVLQSFTFCMLCMRVRSFEAVCLQYALHVWWQASVRLIGCIVVHLAQSAGEDVQIKMPYFFLKVCITPAVCLPVCIYCSSWWRNSYTQSVNEHTDVCDYRLLIIHSHSMADFTHSLPLSLTHLTHPPPPPPIPPQPTTTLSLLAAETFHYICCNIQLFKLQTAPFFKILNSKVKSF